MDLFKQNMKGPLRPAPSIPTMGVNRYSPVTNWNDDPFDADVFEPKPHYTQKKKPPPRPPPPKVNSKQPDIPLKPSHFIRKPTVLSSLLSRKNKNTVNYDTVIKQTANADLICNVDPVRIFPKCEPKNVQTASLIDLSSPPSSPTFTTRSSSDGLSVDSFGSDATTSTNHNNAHNGGSSSQAESGFEDDFDLFLNSRKIASRDDTFENFSSVDPFSPQPMATKPPLMRKPVVYAFEPQSNSLQVPLMKGPTIIRVKPARPKPPDNSALLKCTFGNNIPVTLMTVNTTTPIHKVGNGFGDNFLSKPLCWDDEPSDREPSPPMPSIPPPPPPPEAEQEIPDGPEITWSDLPVDSEDIPEEIENEDEPYAIALYDYFTDHPEDLCFSANSKIKLIRRVDAEWLCGSLRSGAQGLFPSNYVEIKIPLPNESLPPPAKTATALYDFTAVESGDLKFNAGDVIKVLHKVNDEWYFGECHGIKGQFPANYVQMS